MNNAARSGMAEALARPVFGSNVRVRSAGSAPSTVDPFAVKAMAKPGIDFTGARSRSAAEMDVRTIDLAVTL